MDSSWLRQAHHLLYRILDTPQEPPAPPPQGGAQSTVALYVGVVKPSTTTFCGEILHERPCAWAGRHRMGEVPPLVVRQAHHERRIQALEPAHPEPVEGCSCRASAL